MQSVHSIESPSVTSCQTVVGVLVSGLDEQTVTLSLFIHARYWSGLQTIYQAVLYFGK